MVFVCICSGTPSDTTGLWPLPNNVPSSCFDIKTTTFRVIYFYKIVIDIIFYASLIFYLALCDLKIFLGNNFFKKRGITGANELPFGPVYNFTYYLIWKRIIFKRDMVHSAAVYLLKYFPTWKRNKIIRVHVTLIAKF